MTKLTQQELELLVATEIAKNLSYPLTPKEVLEDIQENPYDDTYQYLDNIVALDVNRGELFGEVGHDTVTFKIGDYYIQWERVKFGEHCYATVRDAMDRPWASLVQVEPYDTVITTYSPIK